MAGGEGPGTAATSTDVSHRHLLFATHVEALLSAEQLSQSSGPPHDGSIVAAGSENTVYNLSVPPAVDGATHLTTTSLSALTPYTPVGAPGTVPGTSTGLYPLQSESAASTTSEDTPAQSFEALTLK